MGSRYINERDRTHYSNNFDLLDGMTLTAQGFPIMKPVREMPKVDELIEFNRVMTEKRNPGNLGVCFYIDDYQFARVWNDPWTYVEKLRQFKFVVQTQFSSYTDYPRPLRMYQHYRNMLLGAFWQKQGITVIPSPGWSGDDSFEWTFEGLPKNSVIATSTIGVAKYRGARGNFVRGLRRCIDDLSPKGVILYGIMLPEMEAMLRRESIPWVRYRHGQRGRTEHLQK